VIRPGVANGVGSRNHGSRPSDLPVSGVRPFRERTMNHATKQLPQRTRALALTAALTSPLALLAGGLIAGAEPEAVVLGFLAGPMTLLSLHAVRVTAFPSAAQRTPSPRTGVSAHSFFQRRLGLAAHDQGLQPLVQVDRPGVRHLRAPLVHLRDRLSQFAPGLVP